MESLAREGIILESHYVQPICTPTRAALMTGYYPIHTGRQVNFKIRTVPKEKKVDTHAVILFH